MAYREFHNEKYYDRPDLSYLEHSLDKSAENIGTLFSTLAAQQIAKRAAADQYKFDLGEGKFENDDKIFFEAGRNMTERGKQEMRSGQRLTPQHEQDQAMWLRNKNMSDWQYKKFEQNEKDILAREKEDIYFDPQPDRDANKLAAYGDNNDVYYSTRGERLDAYDKVKGKLPQSLRGKKYTYDYVKFFGKKEKTKSVGDPNYESTTYDASPFLTPQGTPGVTIDHAKEYLNSRSDGSVARWIEMQVDQDMDADVKYMKERAPEFKGMSDEEIKLYLKANPNENQFNKKDYATRVIEKAQTELTEAADIAKKTDYQTKVDKSLTGGLYNNDAIGHSYASHVDEPVATGGTNVSDPLTGFGVKLNVPRNNMPGGNLRIGKGAKIGQAIPVDMNPRRTFNIRTGQSEVNRGTTAFNVTGYQTAVLRKDGSIYSIDVDKLGDIPDKDKANLQPELGVVFRGYTIDRGNMLGEIATRQSQLDNEIATAVRDGDTEKQGSAMTQLDKLKALSQMINLSKNEFSDEDLMSALRQNGVAVNSVKRDVIITPSEADFALIDKNITQGLNLKDRGKWSQEMLAADEKYRSVYGTRAENVANSTQQPAPPVLMLHPDGRKGYVPFEQMDDALAQGYKKAD